MRLTTAMMEEHNAASEPVDCVALLDLIEAAQKVYTKYCPILRPEQ